MIISSPPKETAKRPPCVIWMIFWASSLKNCELAAYWKTLWLFFTSDESHGVLGHPFGGHWGLYVALGDGVPERLSPQVFGQADVALSVLDYLGMDNENFLGRSIFRDNTAFRPMPFGRFILDSPGRVFSCKREFCDLYQWETGGLFAPAYRVSQIPAAAAALSSQKQRNVSLAPICFWGEAQTPLYSLNGIFFWRLSNNRYNRINCFYRKNRRWKLF